MDMNQITNESYVYEILKENIKEPGRYSIDPEVSENRFPENEPIFTVLYGGVGYEVSGWIMLIQLFCFFLFQLLQRLCCL
jgi:hypothetical protein